MKPEYIPMIYRVSLSHVQRKTSKGVVKDGPYWYGYWMENGKQRRVYIGKVLPEKFEHLLNLRSKRPGGRYYNWPGLPQSAR